MIAGGGDALDRALTIQIIMREKASAPGRAYYVTEDEIRERQERAERSGRSSSQQHQLK